MSYKEKENAEQLLAFVNDCNVAPLPAGWSPEPLTNIYICARPIMPERGIAIAIPNVFETGPVWANRIRITVK